MGFEIQHLAVIVDPQANALLINDDPFNDPFNPDSWKDITDNPIGFPIRNPIYPQTGDTRWIRFGGSGIQPNGKVAPKIVPENSQVNVGDSAVNINVLTNDRFTGTPRMRIIAWQVTRDRRVTVIKPAAAGLVGAVWTTSDGATATIFDETGGTASRLQYKAPTDQHAQGGAEKIWYELEATGSSGKAKGFTTVDILRVEVDPALGDHHGDFSIVGPDTYEIDFDDDNGESWTGDWGTGKPVLHVVPSGSTFTINMDPSGLSSGRVVVSLTSWNAGTSTYEGTITPE